MFTCQVASDLHIERQYPQAPVVSDFLTPSADVLILAGDIGSLYYPDQLTVFLKSCVEKFNIVLYVPGNHEFSVLPRSGPLLPRKWPFFALKRKGTPRTSKYQQLLQNLVKMVAGINQPLTTPKLFLLNNESVVIGKHLFIGSTFWSRAVEYNPRSPIAGIDKQAYNKLHQEARKYLDQMLQMGELGKYKPIVITHYPPSANGTLKSWWERDPTTMLYYSDSEDLLQRATIWISGHTHYNYDYFFQPQKSEKGKPVRFLSNQYRAKFFHQRKVFMLSNYL